MAKTDDGGPAFAQHILNPNSQSYAVASNVGMSLRDWFAGQALSATIALHWESYHGGHWGENADAPNCLDIAFDCYQQADAMLAIRNKSQTQEI